MSRRYKGAIISATAPTTSTTSASGEWTLPQQFQAQGAGTWPSPPSPYIEDWFSTYLYTGNGSTQTITNSIDLTNNGGLVWIKSRSAAYNNSLTDTARGAANAIYSNSTLFQNGDGNSAVNPFLSSGFTLNSANINENQSGIGYVSWTFAKRSKFFDVVTYTGTGVAGRTVSHNLGSVPGCIIVKRTDLANNWKVYHRGINSGVNPELYTVLLNYSDAAGLDNSFNDTPPTSTVFSVSGSASVNASGGTYVAYLFAHDAGGFGLTGSDNVISCGFYTGNGTTNNITLGYEPQWLLVKRTDTASDWRLGDIMRGSLTAAPGTAGGPNLYPNQFNAEDLSNWWYATSTGFATYPSNGASYNASGGTYIYIAIRRGPMKTPTVGTSVFAPVAYASTNVDNRLVNTGIVTDMTFDRTYDGSSTAGGTFVADRLRGDYFFGTAVTDAEAIDTDSFMTPTVGYGNSFSAQNGFGVGNDVSRRLNYSTFNMVAYAFRRAPGFFDVVCYPGAASPNPYLVSHNLGVSPELIIIKARNNVTNWYVWGLPLGIPGAPAGHMFLNLTNASATTEDQVKSVSSTTFGLKPNENLTSGVGYTYVAYLFATLAGVSKVGSFTGTAALQTVNCGFTTGARFVMIKRTDSTSDWYVWNSARGITSGNDPYLRLNLGDIEDTATNYVDTDTTGFKVTAAASATVNASGGTYLFLAIA